MNMRINNQDAINYHQSDVEVGNTELQKHSDQTRRLGSKSYRQHPNLADVKGAVQLLQPEQLLEVLKTTQLALGGNSGTVQISDQDIPQLQIPQSLSPEVMESGSELKLSTSATMAALLEKITQLTTDTSLISLLSRLEGYNAMMEGAGEAYSSLANQLEQQGEAWAAASDALKDAQQKANELSVHVSAAQYTLEDAQRILSGLEAEAIKQDPVSTDLQKQIDAARVAVIVAQTSLAQIIEKYNDFKEQWLKLAIVAEKNTRLALESTQSQSKALIASLSPQQQNTIELHRKQNNEQAKTLTFLMALMAQLVDKSSSDDLQAAAELKQKLAEASARDAKQKAKDYEVEVRKAQEMQKTMGCIGKVLGWVITAISFAAAAFTGGASLAFAAVGLALAIGDEICQAVTGRSFMAESMQPFMDAIVKPLMEAMGKMFAAILEGFGVDKDTAAMVGQILGAIAAAAALVVAVVVASNVVGKVFGIITKKIGTDVAEAVAQSSMKRTLQRLMDSSVGQIFKRLSQGIGRAGGMDELKMAQISNRTQIALTSANVMNISLQAGGRIAVASMQVDASKIRAQMMKDSALQDLLNEMMNRIIDAFAYRIETVNRIVKNISEVADHQIQTGKFISRQMSNIAV